MNRKATPQLNRNELELISAYLDGQLPEEQARRLRQRIAQDPAFKQVYEDLRLTRLALRRTPQIRRRRSFTLTPEMVGKPARVWNLQATSRLVAVVATVLLAVVFVGDMFLLPRAGTGMSFLSAANNAAESYLEDSADMDAMSEEASGGGAPMPMAAEQAVEEGETVGEADSVEAAPLAPPEPAVEAGDDDAAEAADTPADEAVEADGDMADEEGLFAGTSVPTPTLAPQGTKAPEASRTEPTEKFGTAEGDTEAADDAVNEMDAAAVETEPGLAQMVEEQEREPSFFDRVDVVTVIELALLALALVSGAVALVVGRRGR